jgi:hypothetical protein
LSESRPSLGDGVVRGSFGPVLSTLQQYLLTLFGSGHVILASNLTLNPDLVIVPKWIGASLPRNRTSAHHAIAICILCLYPIIGCVKAPALVIEAKLNSMKTHSVSEISKLLGPPDATSEAGHNKTYTWRYDAVVANCFLEIVADQSDKIEDYRFSGTSGGCGEYAHRLDSSYRRVQDLLNFDSKDDDVRECGEEAEHGDPSDHGKRMKSCMMERGYRYFERFEGCNGKDLQDNPSCYSF